MQYGFAIDQRTCIGCHACTVACKTEHEVPLGAVPHLGEVRRARARSRTSPRDFGVMRCNHCTDARASRSARPTRCSSATTASSTSTASAASAARRACRPARTTRIYIDPETTPPRSATSAPTGSTTGSSRPASSSARPQSILVGDLDDPDTGISRLVATNDTVGAAPRSRTPGRTSSTSAPTGRPRPAGRAGATAPTCGPQPRRARGCGTAGDHPWTRTRPPRPRSTPPTRGPGAGGCSRTCGRRASRRAPCSSRRAGVAARRSALGAVGGCVAPLAGRSSASAVTGVLLVWDLKRPERFLYLFTRAAIRRLVARAAAATSCWSSALLRGCGCVAGCSPLELIDCVAGRCRHARSRR